MLATSNTPGWRRFLPSPAEDIPSGFAAGHAGQSILVTGAGGYIGSALSHAIAEANPSHIVLLDASEENLYDVDQRLESTFGHVPRAAVLGSVGDPVLLDHIFSRFRPGIVYHAAAFKHVPLVERNPVGGVRNNAIGTYVLAQAAISHGALKLILVSTDKAVNPHSVMGASKRIAELTVVALSSEACRMNAIRLGNVIGSPGSIVPAFLTQIAKNGPVTVTHPEASRWFLTLRGAVEAILRCGRASCEGKILLPELGDPVRIAELAAFLLQDAKKDIPVVYTGLRAGDKLTEELVSANEIPDGFAEGLQAIQTRKLSRAELDQFLKQVSCRIAAYDGTGLIRDLRAMIPEYEPSKLQA